LEKKIIQRLLNIQPLLIAADVVEFEMQRGT
jgi:hypothetical protein